MQFKLLQFYKVLSNFSTNLISGFIPLLIYQETQSVYLAVASLVLGYLFNILFNYVLKTLTYRKPELCLCLRILPIISMQISLLFISKSPIIIMFVLAASYGLNYTFKNVPSDIIYNYSVPANTKASTLALSRAFEQVGYVAAAICGGWFLDYIPFAYLISISLSLYFVSSLPLMILYFKNRNNKNFNAELVSNAHIHFETQDSSEEGKMVCNKVRRSYILYNIFLTGVDAFYMLFGFATYLKTGSFLISGTLGGACDAIYGIMAVVVGKLDAKKDLTIMSIISSIVISLCIVGATLTMGEWPSFIFYEIIPVFWPFTVIFSTQRMFTKSKVLGITNECTFNRYNAQLSGQAICYAFGLTGVLWLVFAVGAAFVFTSGVLCPYVEEHTRKTLVDYIEDNES